MIYLKNVRVLTPKVKIESNAVLIRDGEIDAVGSQAELSCPPEAQVIDALGNYLVPGLIDLQINGGFGADFTADPPAMWQVGERLPEYGVTAFLPTIISSPLPNIEKARSSLLRGKPDGYYGATPLGLHLEGPFLNPQKRGAHNPDYMLSPELNLVEDWSPEDGVRMVTLAPELPRGLSLIEKLVGQGVLVAVGHSQASYAQTKASLEAGVRYGTHLFNAMPALHHREPGLIGALLEAPSASVGLIADGVHLHPVMISFIYQLVGAERISLVTDAMAGLGMPEGRYHLGGQEVSVESELARLSDETLAGSVLGLNNAVRNLIQFTSCAPQEALMTVTHVPARLLGLEDRVSKIEPGYRADLTLLSMDFEVIATFVGGQLAYRADGAEKWNVRDRID